MYLDCCVDASTRVNTTASDGKVVITGDHNKVSVSARESKIALAEIQGKLESMVEKDEKFSKKLEALEKRLLSSYTIQENFNAMNKTIKVLSEMVEKLDEELSRKLRVLYKRILSLDMTSQEKLASMNETVKTLNNTVQSQEKTIRRMNNSSARLHTQIQAISHRISAFIERQVTHFDYLEIFFFNRIE